MVANAGDSQATGAARMHTVVHRSVACGEPSALGAIGQHFVVQRMARVGHLAGHLSSGGRVATTECALDAKTSTTVTKCVLECPAETLNALS